MSGLRLTAPWLRAEAPAAVCRVLAAGGHRALFVGGCVRNALLDRPVSDIDIATDATPDEVAALGRAAGLKVVPTGIAHGTVTLVVRGAPVEVTTFRRDVETDGRHAVVAYTRDVAEDAARRDFTMNALYARPDGEVIDPLGGLPDLRAGRVRFVGDPSARITEDYLRILRFFRFQAWYGDPSGGIDAEGLAACAAHQDGLGHLSRERVGAEMRKLLAAPDPAPAVCAMAASGILGRVLPGAEARALAPLVQVEAAREASWLRRLAALGARDGWGPALRLSRAEVRALGAVQGALEGGLPPAASAYRFGAGAAEDAALIRAAALAAALAPDLEAEISRGAAAVFPLRAADFDLEGAALGARLRALEALWVSSDLRLPAAELRAAMP